MQISERRNLSNGFSRYFRIDPALDDRLLDEVFHVRHEVYCEDLGFEPPRADHREIDAYDAHSAHCLLRAVDAPYNPVGCTRIVLANPAAPDAPLPFERSCAATLDRSIIDPARLPRDRIAEISRLAVRGQYRRRKGEQRSAVAIQDEDFAAVGDQQRFPFIPTSLLLGAVALAERRGVDTVFVLTEPRLAKHFSHLGVEVRQIGGPISHRGTRIPSVMQVEEIIRNMRSLIRPLWEIVREQINRGFDAAEALARAKTA
jgi:N-acyl amino acid synthase of PEP-CTERM/exosortase system